MGSRNCQPATAFDHSRWGNVVEPNWQATGWSSLLNHRLPLPFTPVFPAPHCRLKRRPSKRPDASWGVKAFCSFSTSPRPRVPCSSKAPPCHCFSDCWRALWGHLRFSAGGARRVLNDRSLGGGYWRQQRGRGGAHILAKCSAARARPAFQLVAEWLRYQASSVFRQGKPITARAT